MTSLSVSQLTLPHVCMCVCLVHAVERMKGSVMVRLTIDDATLLLPSLLVFADESALMTD